MANIFLNVYFVNINTSVLYQNSFTTGRYVMKQSLCKDRQYVLLDTSTNVTAQKI
jgi:hypothetical protein